MKKSFKSLVLVLCLAMCAAFTACDKEPASSGSEASQDVSSTSASATEDSLPTVSDMITDNASNDTLTDDTSSNTSTDDTSSEAVSESDDAEAYSEVLASYKKIADSVAAGTFNFSGTVLNDFPCLNESISYKWISMLREFADINEFSNIELGYALYDIDKDGTNELFLINQKHDIYAIFTLKDGNVQLLDAYWARYISMLSNDDTVFTQGYGGAATYECVVYKLSEGSFVEIASFGCESGNYYIDSDEQRMDITQEEFFIKADSYVNNNSILNFIAI